MKMGLLALGLTIACLCGISAQAPQPQPWAEKLFGPPENLVHDFGTVPAGSQLHHDFVITNIYAVPIEITNIRASMGCVTASPSKELLQPNEKGTIRVRMDGRLFSGQKLQTIFVTIGPLYFSQARLTVKANTRKDLVCFPGDLAFGSVVRGQTPIVSEQIEYAGTLAWHVSDVIVPKEAPFEATLKELYRRSGDVNRVGYEVKATVKKDAAPGRFLQTIFLKTNDPDGPMVPVQVTGNVQEPLEAVPAALNLGEVKSGETLTRQVLVRSPTPFKVIGIEGPKAVRLGEPPLPNQWQTVTLEIIPPSEPGAFHYEVQLKTDVQDTPVVVVIGGIVSKT